MKLEPIFSNGMVLQRGKTIKITGSVEKEKEIVVRFLDTDYKAAIKDGKFEAELTLNKAGGPYTMQITSDKESILFEDVYVGDVYLLGGQSNIEFKMKDEAGKDEIEELKNIHVYTVNPVEYVEAGKEYPSFATPVWKSATKEALSDFSAIGYYIAKELNDLNVPVGFVSCNKGGTSASCWIDEKHFEKNEELNNHFVKEYEKAIADQSDEEEEKARIAFEAVSKAYQDKLNAFMKEHPNMPLNEVKKEVGHTPWPGPKGKKDFGRPCGLYHTMFERIIDYTFKAVVWYQGEEDSGNAKLYEALLRMLIETWRDGFGEKVPFYIIQLPRYREAKNENWPVIRTAQEVVANSEPNTHLIVTIDQGEEYNVHPSHKDAIGKRTADTILEFEYGGKSHPYPRPLFSFEIPEGIVLMFSQPIEVRENSKGWKQYGNTMALVPQSDYIVKYAQENYPEVFLFSKEGLPVIPFTYDILKDEKEEKLE